VIFSLVSFWLAVRPPRIAIPLGPGDYGLKVETVTSTADDGVRLAAWLPAARGRAGARAAPRLPRREGRLFADRGALSPRFTVLLLDQR